MTLLALEILANAAAMIWLQGQWEAGRELLAEVTQ